MVAAAGQNLQLENVTGGKGNDWLKGNSLKNTLTGGPGNDQLEGLGGDDTYAFGAAVGMEHDTLVETVGGGTGDTLLFSSLPATVGVTIDLSSSTTSIGSHAGRELLVPANGQGNYFENLTGGSGPDTLIGNASKNVLAGGKGNDLLIGGPGDDTYVFTKVTGIPEVDIVSESPSGGNDTLSFATLLATDGVTVDLTNDSLLAAHSLRTIQTANPGEAIQFENAIGGKGNDTLQGNGAANVLIGGLGDDSLFGFQGNDTLEGGAGNDLLDGGQDDDTYVFNAAIGNELDTIFEAMAEGTDTLDFGKLGSSVPVTIDLGTSTTLLASHSGRIVQVSAPGVAASLENAIGGAAADTIFGNAADNVLVGGKGNDFLDGADGWDTLDGGAGNDTGINGEVLINFP